MKGFCGLLLLTSLLFGIAYSLDCYACSEANPEKCKETIKCESDEMFCMTNYTAVAGSNSKSVLHRSINKADTNSNAERNHHLQQHSNSKRGHHLQHRSPSKRGDRTREAPPRGFLPMKLWRFYRRSVNKADTNSNAEMSHNLQERSPKKSTKTGSAKKSGRRPKPDSAKKTGDSPEPDPAPATGDSPEPEPAAKRSHNLQERSPKKSSKIGSAKKTGHHSKSGSAKKEKTDESSVPELQKRPVVIFNYADDLQLIFNIDSSPASIENVQSTMTFISSWMNANQLKLNPDKTKLVLTGPPGNPWNSSSWPRSLGCPPSPVNSVKSLGVTISAIVLVLRVRPPYQYQHKNVTKRISLECSE
ncbi:uncharacterized protein LOC144827959 [Lissotriton helveticus]